jgi:AraC family transcriptional regulator, regulatory protein of adaptative response / methylphosphotriester-DNA alkyltransferase methyltransferase
MILVTSTTGHAMQRERTTRFRTDIYRDAIELIAAEYERDLRLDDVAYRVAASRRQLQRCFCEIGQTTFSEHLTAVRMQRAAEMLTTGTRHVRAIAKEVGYSQPAQFAKAFRRYHGVTPGTYRTQRRLAAAAAAQAG